MEMPSQMPTDMPPGLAAYWDALRRLLVKARPELPPDERQALDDFERSGGSFLFQKDGDIIRVVMADPVTERAVIYATVPVSVLESDGTTAN